MTDEQRIELEALIAIREGMVAENKIRESLGYAMAYNEHSFQCLAMDMRKLKAARAGEVKE